MRNAANLMRIVTPGEDVIDTGEGDGEFEGMRIEIHRVEVELF